MSMGSRCKLPRLTELAHKYESVCVCVCVCNNNTYFIVRHSMTRLIYFKRVQCYIIVSRPNILRHLNKFKQSKYIIPDYRSFDAMIIS